MLNVIKLKELINRIYVEKQCVCFDFCIPDTNSIVRFERKNKNENEIFWVLKIINESTNYKNSEVYEIPFTIPKNDLSLQMICAIGLKYYQAILKEEVQDKTNLDFEIGNLVEGMFG